MKDRRKSEPPRGLEKLSKVFEQRPVLVAVAGPNGAGRTTFFHAHLSRFPRTLVNLLAAIRQLPHVLIFDNDDLAAPFRKVAIIEGGELVWSGKPLPRWLGELLTAF